MPVAAAAITTLTLAVFLAQAALSGGASLTGSPHPRLDALYTAWGFVPAQALAHPVTILSYSLLHLNTLHIALNLLTVWAFSPNLEKALTTPRYAALYAASAAASALAYMALDPSSPQPLIGASGAAAALAAAYMATCPSSPIAIPYPHPYPRFVLVPAWPLVLAWAALQLVMPFALPGPPPPALTAHAAGFTAGAITGLLLRPRQAP